MQQVIARNDHRQFLVFEEGHVCAQSKAVGWLEGRPQRLIGGSYVYVAKQHHVARYVELVDKISCEQCLVFLFHSQEGKSCHVIVEIAIIGKTEEAELVRIAHLQIPIVCVDVDGLVYYDVIPHG